MWRKSMSEQLCDILLWLQLFFIWTSCQKPICKPGPHCPGHTRKKMVPVPKLSPWNRRQEDINWVLMGQREKCCAQKGIPGKYCSGRVDRHRQGLGSAGEMAGLNDFRGPFQTKWFPVIPRPFGTPQRKNVGVFALGFGNICIFVRCLVFLLLSSVWIHTWYKGLDRKWHSLFFCLCKCPFGTSGAGCGILRHRISPRGAEKSCSSWQRGMLQV